MIIRGQAFKNFANLQIVCYLAAFTLAGADHLYANSISFGCCTIRVPGLL
jgi:hypothetical protein